MVALSARQNNGQPRMARGCQPELKSCITGIYFKSKNDTEMLIKETEDMNGRTIRRELCEFNSFGDVRQCVDYDIGSSHRDMKDLNGNWQKVGDE